MFYGADDGNRLVDESNYPDSIKKFLEDEKNILISNIGQHDVIIEVGCMEARNMEHAINSGKKYIGIDIVPEYIEIANSIVKKRKLSDVCEFLCINAEMLDVILYKSNLLKDCTNPLFFFPFNSFGNMEKFSNVLKSVSRIRNADFIIFSYNTDEHATEERFKYYGNCDYDNLKMHNEKDGVRFTADNGLNSMAYDKSFLESVIKKLKMQIETAEFADIGLAYFISTREREKNEEEGIERKIKIML